MKVRFEFTIDDLIDVGDSVEITLKKAGLIVVRNRAFSSPEEKSRFVELGRTLLAGHGGG